MNNIIKTFPNPCSQRNYTIVFSLPHFLTSCPNKTSPELAHLEVSYIPDQLCIEADSLREYWSSFKDQGIFYETTINQIFDDIMYICKPRWLKLNGSFDTEGDIKATIVIES